MWLRPDFYSAEQENDCEREIRKDMKVTGCHIQGSVQAEVLTTLLQQLVALFYTYKLSIYT